MHVEAGVASRSNESGNSKHGSETNDDSDATTDDELTAGHEEPKAKRRRSAKQKTREE